MQGATAVAADSLLQERASLTRSSAMIDEFTSAAENVLTGLRSQRGVLKGAHRKALDVAANLGLSSTMMRVIERRTTADKILVYGGMAAVMLLLAVVWWVRR
jgi:Golgi SNAP receptor complex protein 2